MFRRRLSGPTPHASVRAVVQRDRRYLLARYVGLRSARWTLPGVPDWDARVEPTRVLRDALWHDVGMAVRSQRRVGQFRDSTDGRMCLVVDAEVLGEPDPDPARVLEVGWFTRAQVEALDGAGLLAGGFEQAALDRAQEQRKHTLSAAVCHLARVLLALVYATPEPGLPDSLVVAGAPTPPGRTCWGCGLYSQHKPWCPAR